MITKEMILSGITAGVVELIDSPHDQEPVCKIGEHWFYYAGSEGSGLTSAEYTENVPLEDIAGEIVGALEGIRDDLDGSDEYGYYEAVLNEAGVPDLVLAEYVRQNPPRPDVQVIITVAENKDSVCGGAAMLGSDGVWYWTYNGEKTDKVPYPVIGWSYIEESRAVEK